MIPACKTCAHWKAPPIDGPYEYDRHSQICNPTDPDTYEPMAMPFEVRLCRHPALTFCERPVERNGFGVADGSEYMAVFATAEDFGCVRHEPATRKER